MTTPLAYFREARRARRARATYRLALLESLMEENSRRLAELESYEECRWCAALEKPKERSVCEAQVSGA